MLLNKYYEYLTCNVDEQGKANCCRLPSGNRIIKFVVGSTNKILNTIVATQVKKYLTQHSSEIWYCKRLSDECLVIIAESGNLKLI